MTTSTEDATAEQATAVARSVAASTVSQMAAKLLHLALNVAVSLALVRYFGPARYGDYVLVITVTGLLGLLPDFGLSKLAVREAARDMAATPVLVGSVVAVRLAISVVAALLAQGVVALVGGGPGVRAATAIASLLFLSESILTVVVVFHVRLKQQYEAFVRVAMEAVETGLTFWLIARSASLVVIICAPVVGAAIGVVLAMVIARRRFGLSMRFDRTRARDLLRQAMPIGPAVLVGVAYLKLDGVMIAALRPQREVGIYGAAFQPIEYLFLASAVLINVLFPLLARTHGSDHDRFVGVYRRGTEALLALVMPVAILLAFVAPALVRVVYAPAFAASAQPLQVLGVALVLMTLNAWQGFVLLAGGRQRVTLAYNLWALGINALLNFGLVWLVGYMGAAFTAVATAAFVTACSTAAISRLLSATLDLGRLARVVAANLALAATMAGLVRLLSWPAAAALTLAAYPLWLHLSGVFDLGRLRSLLGSKALPAYTEA
jgi:O-antigen/teichoic acid export membrane protein